MADVTGPIRSLPGSAHHRVPAGAMCDEHDDRVAVARVQGETDSFGSEMYDMCQECWDAFKARDRTEERTGCCDWCHKSATDLRSHRDLDEGMSGPVYRVCGACIARETAALAEELEEMESRTAGWY